tara:strand:+ start:159 stop:1205 length:1047 start_codon:yes stop_codon:yes gene_type:complete
VQITPSDEQRMMLDMMERFLDDSESGQGAPLPNGQGWAQLGELGVLAFALPEAAGGFDGGRPGIAAIAEQFGRALSFTPYAAEGFIAAAGALAQDGQQADALGRALAGETSLSFVTGLPGKPVRAERHGGGLSLIGEGALTLPSDPGGWIILHTKLEGCERLFLVSAAQFETGHDARALVDGTAAMIVPLDGLEIAKAEPLDVDADRIADLRDDFYLAKAAELVGCMRRAFEDTLRHTSERRQFGQSISGFQVVRHTLGRMFIAVEQAQSMVLRAALDCDETLASERAGLEAFAFVAGISLPLAQQAVQLHGGMGVTREMDVSCAHRRILRLSRSEGAPDRLWPAPSQ